MNDSLNQLLSLVNECAISWDSIDVKKIDFEKSETTRREYVQLARSLIERSIETGECVDQIVQKTTKSNTFYKRVAALIYYFRVQTIELTQQGYIAQDEIAFTALAQQFSQLLTHLKSLLSLSRTGLTTNRNKRNSKRQALSNLPPDWRTKICERGMKGKYALPTLVASLTGARPKELVYGIEITSTRDEQSGDELIIFKINGAKVKAGQGQPERNISFSTQDKNPLIQLLLKHIDIKAQPKIRVQIENAANFTVEVRRLAKLLWPKHKHAVTAYCFRHQWSADLKSMRDGDSVSKGLGHISSKTRRYYGTARQASTSEQLRPIAIEASRPLRELNTKEFKRETPKFNYKP